MNLFSNNWLKGEMKIRCLLGHTDMDIGRKCQVKQGVYSITVDAFFEVFVLSPVLVLVVFLVLVQYSVKTTKSTDCISFILFI